MNSKFYCIIFFLSGYLFSSDNSNIQTYNVAGVPVQIVQRLEVETDEDGIQRVTFISAEENETQKVLDLIENDEARQNDLHGADSATVETDRQSNEAYITINYPDGNILGYRLY